jgi:uncharacterized protein
MKLQPVSSQPYQTITAYDEHSIEINACPHRISLIVMPELAPIAWPVNHVGALTEEHVQTIAALNPDLVIIGTGAKQYFVSPKVTACLAKRHIGVECMDNKAACRTYNILMTEGRRVALALILESAP